MSEAIEQPQVDTQSRAERIQQAMEAKKAAAPAAEPEPEAPAAEEPAEPEAETEAAPEGEEPAEPKPEKKAPERKDPKDARVDKAWAGVRKKEAEIAKREREVKRAMDALTKDRAGLSVIQQELADLDKLRRENPAAYVKRVSPDGDVRKLIKSALEEPEIPEEKREMMALKAKIAELEARDQERVKAAKETAERAAREAEQAAEMQRHSENLTTVFRSIDSADGLGVLKSQPPKIKELVARQAYDRILRHYETSGQERNIQEVLVELEGELFPAEQPAPKSGPSAPANGAEPTAKPGAKRAPVLSGTAATSRAASPKKLSRDELIRQQASRLKRA